MLSNASPVPKLYRSIIDDVIESVQELFLDEGLEDCVLEDLRKLWESKVKQSKTGEGFMKDTAKQQCNAVNSSKFVLLHPTNYASIVTPADQKESFTAKNNPGTLATFSLPPGGTYPVQIPAGVTLQTASGQLYKINVPVMVTHAPRVHRPLIQSKPREDVWKCPIVCQPAMVPTVHKTLPPLKTEQYSLPAAPARPITQPPEEKAMLPQSQENHIPWPQVLKAQSIQPQEPLSVQSTWAFQPTLQTPSQDPDIPFDNEFTLDGIEFSPQPIDMSMQSSLFPKISDFQDKSDQTLPQGSEFRANKMKEEHDMVKVDGGAVADMAGNFVLQNMENLPEDSVKLEMDLQDYNYSDLADIIQLDGPADSSSDMEEEEEGAIGESEFLGMINAEALKALEEADGSSDGKGISDNDSDGAEEEVEEEDPLNSGDDVSEQDIPDLFDTDNVIACQYDKIHRSKNRWKFYLKDGVMCFGGRDYVFSKAVGDAEW